MKIVFMGTPDFALSALQALAEEHEIVAVYTKEPKVAGRGNKVIKSPVHIWSEAHNIEVRTPQSLRNAEEQRRFRETDADIAVVAAYGLILPSEVLSAYRFGCVNIHASLLPRWRGAAPIQRSIEAGDKLSGVTIMKMDVGLDTGDMLLQESTAINTDTTGGILHDKLAEIGSRLIVKALREWPLLTPQPQDESCSCYADKISKDECLLDWGDSRYKLVQKIKAFSPYPAVFFEHKGERFKILNADLSDHNLDCGQIKAENGRLFVGCEDGSLEITYIQRQGKKAMTVAELLRGYEF